MEINKEDVKQILSKLDEIEKEISEIKLNSKETSGQMKGNTELLKLEIVHMKREQQLKDEKLIAEISLINHEVQRNKDSISTLYNKDREHASITTKINMVFVALGLLSPAIIYAVIQGVLIWGKVKGF